MITRLSETRSRITRHKPNTLEEEANGGKQSARGEWREEAWHLGLDAHLISVPAASCLVDVAFHHLWSFRAHQA